jgi:DNA invertase Pin-like site-specific DNA recombinase
MTSLAEQERECRAYARRNGWEMAGTYQDTMTGFDSLDQRPALQEVRTLLRDSGADVLIVWKWDRAARDAADLMTLAREVFTAGARFISATQGEAENNATGRMILSTMGGVGDMERENIRDRLAGNMRARVVGGRIKVGPVPKFGYVWVGDRKNTYQINPDTAPVVQRIFQLADDGRSLHEIARILSQDGVLTPSAYLASIGKLPGTRRLSPVWRRQSVYHLLTDPAYCGRHVSYRRKLVTTGGKRVMKLRDDSDETRIEQSIPALVTQEQWERVQAALVGNTLARATDADQNEMPLLTRGIARCGHCGARLTVQKHPRNGYRGYVCSHRTGRVDRPEDACPGGAWFLKAEQVDLDVWAKVQEMMRDTERFQEMMLAPLRETQAQLDQAARQEAVVAAELERARKDKETISRRMATEPDDTISAIYRQQLKDTLAVIAGLESRMSSQDRKADKLRAYLDALFSAAGGWKDAEGNDVAPDTILSAIAPTPTRDRKRNLLRAIGARILIYSGTSGYAEQNGTRWDLQIIPGLYTPGGQEPLEGMPTETIGKFI